MPKDEVKLKGRQLEVMARKAPRLLVYVTIDNKNNDAHLFVLIWIYNNKTLNLQHSITVAIVGPMQ